MSSSGDDSSVFDQFLNPKEDTNDPTLNISGQTITLVDVENPLKWGKLGKTVAGSLIGGIVLGIQRGIEGVIALPTFLLNSLTHWISRSREVFRYPGGKTELWGNGLIVTVREGLLGIFEAAWSPLTGLGWVSFPVTVGVVLTVLFVVVWSLDYVREEVI